MIVPNMSVANSFRFYAFKYFPQYCCYGLSVNPKRVGGGRIGTNSLFGQVFPKSAKKWAKTSCVPCAVTLNPPMKFVPRVIFNLPQLDYKLSLPSEMH